MPRILYRCSECHTPLDADIEQADEDGLVRWHASYFCDECGHASMAAEGSMGFPPDELRNRLVLSEGRFGLVVDDDSLGDSHLARMISEGFGLSMRAAGNHVEEIPGIAFRGTREECEFLERAILREGISVYIQRA